MDRLHRQGSLLAGTVKPLPRAVGTTKYIAVRILQWDELAARRHFDGFSIRGHAMLNLSSQRTFLLAACLTLAAAPAHAQAPVFKAGFAERDITPEIGAEAPGGYGKAHYKSIHDPCKVRAAVFDDGKNPVALVGLDALFIHRETVLEVRKAIAAKTGISEAAILLGASHSHSSGPMAGVMPGEYDHASKLVQKLAKEHTTCADPKYLEKVEKAIVEAVCRAHQSRQDARAGIGRGLERTVAFNRRFKMRDGRTITHPGQGNPDILEPAGPTDPEVGVIGVWHKDRLLGCVVNFACHATTSPGGISANYIHYLEKAIQGYYGKEAVVVFLNGASGDITQVDNQSPYKYPTGERWAQIVGGKVGAEALKVLLTMEPGTLLPLAARTRVLQIKRRAPAPERVRECLKLVEQDPAKAGQVEWTFAKEIVLLDAKLKKEPVTEVEVQAIQVGPAVFLTTPAEYFCRFGLDQKKKSGFSYTFPVSLANGCVGYVPTEDAFAPSGGGYETRLTSYSNLEITAGSRMRDTGIELAKELSPGAAPTPLKPAPFAGKPWSYGDVKPELK
jgi:neutral ceramidase